MPQDKRAASQAARERKLPPWDSLKPKEQQELLRQILQQIAEWRQIPEQVLQSLPEGMLQRLLEIIEQLRAQGLAGPQFRASERIKAMKAMLNRRGLGETPRRPTADEIIDSLPPEERNRIRAQEAVAIRESETAALMGMQQRLASATTPITSLG